MALKDCIAFQLSLGSLANTKKLQPERIAKDDVKRSAAAMQSLKVSKRIMDCPEYAAITTHAQQMSQRMRRRSIPSLLAKGIHLISLRQVEETETWTKEALVVRASLIEVLCLAIDRIASAESAAQGPIGDIADYPTPDQIRRRLWSRYRFLTFDVPGQLAEVNTAIWQEERDKASALYEDIVSNAQLVLLTELQDLLDHMLKLLTPKDDGGKRRLFSSSVGKLREFFSTLPDRNSIAEHPAIVDLAAKAERILAGVDIESLRRSDALRNEVRTGIERVKEALAPMVLEAGERSFSFEDEDA